MKNNQGFSLLAVLGLTTLLSVITITGIKVAQYKAKQTEEAKVAAGGNRLISNVTGGLGTSPEAVARAEHQKLPNMSEDDPNHPLNPENPNNINNPLNPNNPFSPANPNSPNNPGNPANPGSKTCPNPCHWYADPANNNAQTCILSDIDCACLGYCPLVPEGCVYLASGDLHPKYVPAPEGEGIACPGAGASIPPCSAPRVVQCGCPEGNCPVTPLIPKPDHCNAPQIPQCLCPGGISDCGVGGDCPPGQVHQLPWGACGPIGSGTPMSTPAPSM